MKKIIYIAMLCLTNIAFSQMQVGVKGKSISTEISFGRLGQDCRGRGLCSFEITLNETQTNTKISYNKGNNMTLVIDRATITKEEEFKIFGQHLEVNSKANEGVFVLDDDFLLEPQLKLYLEIPDEFTKINNGHYSVQISKDTFTIIFKLE